MKAKIKKTISNFFTPIFSKSAIWKLYKPIAEFNAELYNLKSNLQKDSIYQEFVQKFGYLTEKGVRRGPFKGLKYPFKSSVHSTFFPKLLGYYEFEIQKSIEDLSSNSYSLIVDVGCAEGYYAVGLARLFPDSTLLAYDLLPEAREKTEKLARANGIEVSEKFQIKDACLPDDLLSLNPEFRHLIFSDCEGFEAELFTTEVIKHLRNSDFIIEVHDFIFPGISDELTARFAETHKVKIVQSIDDTFRYRFVEDAELLTFSLSDQIKLLAEKRPSQMEWLVCHTLNK
ncbi:MAG: hypothetical protein ACK4SF_09855 [Algoriphagus aquaeductus]|uniref:hypothetical protein n=1 Tax=Algoriphagus aquaeductus TaxID=475299 RepID=UPI0039192EB6